MTKTKSQTSPVVIGIDVGGPRKGLHAVALEGGRYRAQFATGNVEEMVRWYVGEGATVIAIDAPCAWSSTGRCRPSERALMEQRIWCFSTPAEAVARSKSFYGWMLYGMDLYAALAPTHPVRDPQAPDRERYCFETFPHAIAWHLRGGTANARRKRPERRALLERYGISSPAISNIDTVDAALCAYTAHLASTGAPVVAFGEVATGLIIAPALAIPEG